MIGSASINGELLDPERCRLVDRARTGREPAKHAIDLDHQEHATLNRQHDEYAAAYKQEASRAQELQRQIGDLTAQVVGLERQLAAARRGLTQRVAARLRRR